MKFWPFLAKNRHFWHFFDIFWSISGFQLLQTVKNVFYHFWSILGCPHWTPRSKNRSVKKVKNVKMAKITKNTILTCFDTLCDMSFYPLTGRKYKNKQFFRVKSGILMKKNVFFVIFVKNRHF